MISAMVMCVRYLTHPQVQMDPAVPVPAWVLNHVGRARAATAAKANWLRGTVRVVSSGERKALETATVIAAACGVRPEVREAMHENDRSATGFLSPPEFEAVADQFFANPDVSVRGWERAIEAQARIVRETEKVLERDTTGDILFVGHGAVGTLLFCHLAGVAISRTYDQPAGGGYIFAFERVSRRVIHPWRSIEDLV